MSPATKKAPAKKATPTARKRTTGSGPKPVDGAKKEAVEKPGVEKAVSDETAKATKRTVAPGRKSSEVVTLKAGNGDPTNRDEWDAMVLLAKSEHESYLKWRRDGQPGGTKGQPKRPNVDRLQALKQQGVTRTSLPEGPSATAKKVKATGAGRRTGSIPEGKTAAGLDRMDDAATVAWIRKSDPKGEQTLHGLHKAFRAAGYGANAKRFARLVEQARAAKGK